ncbi:DASH family cryptochrome [Geitlerinema sp. PCC 9228]|jgi:deoxyribodipyrimidine photo-lyase|uniref:DASH family cryptochrome n=1 Tax=Geitlerinema sp. PCC 9228 TaxID=111611 RepID=UPI0008F9BA9F|nr:DASH family cryptochrome [Geitlerinema sp. PCC 9228]
MAAAPILLWYRNDLRLHDHSALQAALQTQSPVIPVYCFDPRQFGTTAFGFPKTGAFRGKFLLESIADLQRSLQQRRSNLLVFYDYPETAIAQLAKRVQASAVYFHQEVTAEEVQVEQALQKTLAQINVTCRSFWCHTLHDRNQFPFAVADLPETFTQFRQQVEANASIELPLPTPTTLPPLPANIESSPLPTLENLGLQEPETDSRGVLTFTGGETAALARVTDYIWQQDCLRRYKQTRNGMLGANYSSKFSPWLALGCLSGRYVCQQVSEYEASRAKNDSTYWLVFELLWRDYFRLIALKHGNRIFYPSGLRGLSLPWQQDWEKFALWQQGKTGFPLVDANMREIAATGYMSNRGRQNVASFLTKNLGIDWRMGAEWFESLLVDYDVCSNWGNWNYTAGVGNDARGFRFFHILKQASKYDPQGRYVKHWLPELAAVPAAKVHQPWQLSPTEQKHFGVGLGVDYPHPVVDLMQSAKTNEKIYNAAWARSS